MADRAKKERTSRNSAEEQGERSNSKDAGRNPSGERVDVTAGGKPRMVQGDLAKQTAALNASTEEEVDALRVDLMQDPRGRDTRNGTGKIVDDLAREHMAGMTEVGPELNDMGVVSAVPGRDNPSSVLRRHHPNTEIARAQDVVEGNLEEPRDEGRMERKVDEGTAA